MDLRSKRCVPCEGGVGKLTPEQIGVLMPALRGWEIVGDKITKRFTFPNFVEAMTFLNRVATVAEEEGHHPDFCVHYNKVDMALWTHAIGGLSENDFILAAKIEAIVELGP